MSKGPFLRILTLALLLIAIAFAHSPSAWAGPNDGLPKAPEALDRSTPRRTLEGFLEACQEGDYARAAHYLDLRAVPKRAQGDQGPTYARQLQYVIERKLTIDTQKLSDVAEGTATGDPNTTIVGTIVVDDEPIAIALTRIRFDDGVSRWLVSRNTLSLLPTLYAAFGAPEWERRLPKILVQYELLGLAPWQWIGLLLAGLASLLAAIIITSAVLFVGKRIAIQTPSPVDDQLVAAAHGPTRLVLMSIGLHLLVDPLQLTFVALTVMGHVSFSLFVIAIAWYLKRAVSVTAVALRGRVPADSVVEMQSRGTRTRLAVLERIIGVVLVVLTIAVLLIQFDFVRSVGMSLLASAGIAGVVVGLAAQKSLGAMIGGIQLSLTQPLRLGDSVTIEGEYGMVEEITLTYVVVKIWDERRLIVPISKILDNAFQNWTKVAPDIHGTVILHVDYSTPVDQLRTELRRLCANDPNWDQRTCAVHVTDATDHVMTLRILVSSRSAARNWDLRCAVREGLIAYLHRLDGGVYIPRIRSETLSPSQPTPAAAIPS